MTALTIVGTVSSPIILSACSSQSIILFSGHFGLSPPPPRITKLVLFTIYAVAIPPFKSLSIFFYTQLGSWRQSSLPLDTNLLSQYIVEMEPVYLRCDDLCRISTLRCLLAKVVNLESVLSPNDEAVASLVELHHVKDFSWPLAWLIRCF